MTAVARLFGEGFRVFFLAAGLYAVFALIVWEGWIGIHAAGGMVTGLPFAPAPHLWHAHEMIFGFGLAAVGGFLLTAVPNWTGAAPARHGFVTLAAGLWLLGRVAMWYSAHLPPALVAVADLAFLPALAARVLGQLGLRPKPQNLMFPGLLALIWAGNLMTHLEWSGLAGDTLWAGLRLGLLGLCAMIAILGGRVTPAFTRNAMTRAGHTGRLPVSRPPLDVAGIASAIALPLAYLLALPDPTTGGLAVLAGLAALARLSGWRGGRTLGQPILWSLHLGYLMLGFGYLALGLAQFGIGSEVAAIHLLGIGAAGGMSLAVMSRASLGHTGRALVAPGPVAAAYALVPLAAVVRAAGSVWPDLYYPAVLGAGALWIFAFTLYLATLWPVFWGRGVGQAAARPSA